MSGIHVTAMPHVIIQTPAQLITLAIFPIMVPERTQVVDISALRTNHFTEHPVLRHVQRIHFKPVVTAVLQNHTVLASLFAHVNQVPALFQIHCGRNFDSHILPVLHSTHGYGKMMQPVGSDINQIDIIALAKFLVSLFAGIYGSFRHRSLL